MTPLPPPLGPSSSAVTFWRLERTKHLSTWRQGLGGDFVGGRWNPKGRRVVYASIDPATALLEVSVHHTFKVFDHVSFTLIQGRIETTDAIKVIYPRDLPDQGWLQPGPPTQECQQFANELLNTHGILVVPSSVSAYSWNIVMDAECCKTIEALEEPFRLDARLTL